MSWASSIAKAAKIGGSDQEELDWDSYENMKSEIAFEQRQWAVYKARAKEMTRIRGQRAAEAKAEKLARLAEKREEREEKAKVNGEVKKKTRKKSKEEREKLAVAQELKLKERLAKVNTQYFQYESNIYYLFRYELEFSTIDHVSMKLTCLRSPFP